LQICVWLCNVRARKRRQALVQGRIAGLEELSGKAAEGIERSPVAGLMSRRQVLQRATALGLGGLVLSALPAAERLMAAVEPALADTSLADATLQAIADTIIPGRKADRTDLGNEIHPKAIAGVHPEPGAVQADALLLFHEPRIGFDALQAAFLSELETRSLARGGQFLDLPFDKRVAVCLDGCSASNPSVVVWEAAAAVAFAAFLAAATQQNATIDTSSALQVMGHPGTAPNGYADYSYGKRLASERTATGSLP
jgi:hypothetical protein